MCELGTNSIFKTAERLDYEDVIGRGSYRTYLSTIMGAVLLHVIILSNFGFMCILPTMASPEMASDTVVAETSVSEQIVNFFSNKSIINAIQCLPYQSN